ncbi:MAG: hypothetical protein QMD80_09550, partial [archaeon]|nr:hypothetical protein [archaeon]
MAPQIKKGGKITFYLVEVRDEGNKLIKRFKPFKESKLEVGEFWSSIYSEWVSCIMIPESEASKLNIGRNYKVGIIISKYNNKSLLPFEIKSVGYDSERIAESLSKLEKSLLTLIVEQQFLNEAASFLYDSYVRLEENDVEGARTSIRKSLDTLRDDFTPQIVIVEEAKNFQGKIKKLIDSLRGLVHYGGPHRGPAPRASTEVVISITA